MILQFIKFIGVGGLNTIITYLFYLLLLPLFDYTISYTITYIFGIGFSYWLNLKFVFYENSSVRKIIIFPLVYVIQYIIGIAVLYFAVDYFKLPKELGPLLIIVLTIPVTFILSKKILTKRGPQ